MKKILILFLILISVRLYTQSYLGNNNNSLCLIQEQKASFITWGFKTVIKKKSEFKVRVGFEYRQHRFSGVIFLPVLNIALAETQVNENTYLTLQYDTPLNAEIRYYHENFAVFGGIEIKATKPYMYFNLLLPFN